MSYDSYHDQPTSVHPKAVESRGWRTALKERDPEQWRRNADKQRERHKARLKSDPEYLAAHNARNNKRLKERRSSPDTWARFALNQIRARAKKEGLPFDLSWQDLSPPVCCPILGFELVYGGGTGEVRAPSVDRLVPALGYTKGNVHVISRRANSIKNDATSSEIQKVADWCRQWGV